MDNRKTLTPEAEQQVQAEARLVMVGILDEGARTLTRLSHRLRAGLLKV